MKQEQSFDARNGALCACALIVAGLIVNAGLRFAWENSEGFAKFAAAHPASTKLIIYVLRASYWIAIAFFCSRARSWRAFAVQVGLGRRPGSSDARFILFAAAIGLLNLLGVIQGWDPSAGEENSENVIVWLLIACTIVIAPFYEEIVFRGFLYGAFRASYGIVLSTIVTVIIGRYFHWGLLMISPFGMLCGTVLGVFLCWVRERTGNTWVCILCHAAYNAIVTWQWVLVLVVIAAVFLFGNRDRGVEMELR